MSNSTDCVRRTLTKDETAVITVVDGTELVRESMERTNSWPAAMIHLGQSMLGGVLLQSSLDREDTDKITLQWNVDGPFGNLYSEVTKLGTARGTILNPQTVTDDLNPSLGSGILQVRRVSSKGTAFEGIVPSVGNVSDDLVQYLESSEQRMCGMNLSVQISWDESKPELPFKIDSALGYLVDVLPEDGKSSAPDSLLLKWDQIMRAMGKISEWALPEEDRTTSMLKLLTGESDFKEVFYQRLEFRCRCNQDRAEQALELLLDAEKNDKNGDEEASAKASESGETTTSDDQQTEEIRCEFCGKVYQSDRN